MSLATVHSAHSATIPGLYATGVDSNGSLLAPGSNDPHYQVLETGNPAVVMSSIPGSWISNNSSSQWLWETSSGNPTNVTINSGFVAGINTLDFVVRDVGFISGFRVDSLSGIASPIEPITVPEASSVLGILAIGMLALGFSLGKSL